MASRPEQRYIGVMFHIDTNRINARQRLENMNRLEAWAESHVILLEMAEVTMNEAIAGSNTERRKKAMGSLYSMTLASTPHEQQMLRDIEAILFPAGADTSNKMNDVEIVFNAAKYGRVLVTADGGSKSQPMGILGNAKGLKRAVGVEVMSDAEAVALVEERIRRRDARCRWWAEKSGSPLPEWVDQD